MNLKQDSISDLEDELFNYGKMITSDAISLAKEDKRKTVFATETK